MLKNSPRLRVAALCVACALGGAGASAIATAGAHADRDARAAWRPHREGFRHGTFEGAVHGDLIVPDNGTFATVTFDRGTVDSVSGQDLTLTEGTKTATYKQLTLTIPTTAKVRNNGDSSTLSQLSGGERVLVVQAPQGTFVIAHTPHGS